MKWNLPKNTRSIPIVVQGSPQTGYTATTPALKGCIAEGDTLQESIDDFHVALSALLKEYNGNVPWQRIEGLPLQQADTRVFIVEVVDERL